MSYKEFVEDNIYKTTYKIVAEKNNIILAYHKISSYKYFIVARRIDNKVFSYFNRKPTDKKISDIKKHFERYFTFELSEIVKNFDPDKIEIDSLEYKRGFLIKNILSSIIYKDEEKINEEYKRFV